jgi:hypothetical protein
MKASTKNEREEYWKPIYFSAPQRRIRPAPFAKELGISLRKLRELFTLGAPITKVQGLVFINPDTFYAWLDNFEQKGSVGIKGRRGASVSKAKTNGNDQ